MDGRDFRSTEQYRLILERIRSHFNRLNDQDAALEEVLAELESVNARLNKLEKPEEIIIPPIRSGEAVG